tara:strand:- start:3639 stop:3992 length:354 start_codon:yes stop_codon:yes gene_type:complete
MKSFSVTYHSNGKKEGKTNGKWKNIRRGKTFVTVISNFKPELKPELKKKVTFKYDSENIEKPKASKIAVFSIKHPPNIMRIKTNEEIEKENLKEALAFLKKKKKKGGWKPSFLRKKN